MTQSELPEGWTDWNTLSLDQLVDHLEKEFMVSSTGTAKAVNELVRFYRNRESLLKERIVFKCMSCEKEIPKNEQLIFCKKCTE